MFVYICKSILGSPEFLLKMAIHVWLSKICSNSVKRRGSSCWEGRAGYSNGADLPDVL